MTVLAYGDFHAVASLEHFAAVQSLTKRFGFSDYNYIFGLSVILATSSLSQIIYDTRGNQPGDRQPRRLFQRIHSSGTGRRFKSKRKLLTSHYVGV